MKKITTPSEKITRRAHEIGIFNGGQFLRTKKIIVQLACSHYHVTRNIRAAVCPRCSEMLRRSIEDGREDWDGFRNGNVRDWMEWPADPCRQFNEPRRPQTALKRR